MHYAQGIMLSLRLHFLSSSVLWNQSWIWRNTGTVGQQGGIIFPNWRLLQLNHEIIETSWLQQSVCACLNSFHSFDLFHFSSCAAVKCEYPLPLPNQRKIEEVFVLKEKAVSFNATFSLCTQFNCKSTLF